MQCQIPCPCCLRYTSTPVPAVPAVPETETYQTTTLKHQVLLLRHFTSNPPWHKNLSLGHFQCAHLPRIAVVGRIHRPCEISVQGWPRSEWWHEFLHRMSMALSVSTYTCHWRLFCQNLTVPECSVCWFGYRFRSEIAVQRSVSPFLSIVSPHSSPSTGSLRSCHG